MKPPNHSCNVDPQNSELGDVLLEEMDQKKVTIAVCLIIGVMQGVIGCVAIAHPQQAEGPWLPFFVLPISTGLLGTAIYYALRNRRWLLYEHAVVEETRWSSRTAFYSDLTSLAYSFTRFFSSDGRYEFTQKLLSLESPDYSEPFIILSRCREEIDLSTDPMKPTLLEEVRDKISEAIAVRMDSSLVSGVSVNWSKNVTLRHEGIEVADAYGGRQVVSWNRIRGVSIAQTECALWETRQGSPFAKINTADENFYPCYLVALRRIESQADREEYLEMAPRPAEGELQCPRCGEFTDSLKFYEFPQVVFLGLHFSLTTDRLAACPRCMRRYVVNWGLVSLLCANILWPFLVFPLFVPRYLASFRRGHSIKTPSFFVQMTREIIGIGIGGVTLFAIISGVFLLAPDPPARNWLVGTLLTSLSMLPVLAILGAKVDL